MSRLLDDPSISYKVRQILYGNKAINWESSSFDITAKVVCATCNNGWMSQLENDEARPAMQDMILSDNPVSLSPKRVQSIARFAFKTAVILNHCDSHRNPFFTSFARRRFATTLEIPDGVQVWLAAFKGRSLGDSTLKSRYAESYPDAMNRFEMFTLTFSVGYLVFQLLATKWSDPLWAGRLSSPTYTQDRASYRISIPIWPHGRGTVSWPPPRLLTMKSIWRFCDRLEHADLGFSQ